MWKNLTFMTINRKGPELFCLIVPMIDSFKEIVNILPHVRKCLQNIPPVHVLHEHNNKSTRLQLRTCKGRYNHGRYNPDWMDHTLVCLWRYNLYPGEGSSETTRSKRTSLKYTVLTLVVVQYWNDMCPLHNLKPSLRSFSGTKQQALTSLGSLITIQGYSFIVNSNPSLCTKQVLLKWCGSSSSTPSPEIIKHLFLMVAQITHISVRFDVCMNSFDENNNWFHAHINSIIAFVPDYLKRSLINWIVARINWIDVIFK